MNTKSLHYTWEWQLASSPESLWPWVSDTNRFNFLVGLPGVEPTSSNGSDESNKRWRFKMKGVEIEWEENPFEWIFPRRFGVVRRYSKGPMTQLKVLVELDPQLNGGTHLKYGMWIEARSFIAQAFISLQMRYLTFKKFSQVIHQYDLRASRKTDFLNSPVKVKFVDGGQKRLKILKAKLFQEKGFESLVERFIDVIEKSDDLSLSRIRPYTLADDWNVPRRSVLELCLLATREGLLEFQWTLLCPMCRGGKAHSSLKNIESKAHCGGCHIDFELNFERLVELTFRPNPSIRQVETREFCIGSPQRTPHIVAQQLIPAQEKRNLSLVLEKGRYLLRAYKVSGGQFVEVSEGGKYNIETVLSEIGWPQEELSLNPSVEFKMVNQTRQEKLFVLERLAWTDQAATAAEVISLQKFRDLFSKEVLRPDQQISVGSLTILFTDLKSSTQLYREVGDASAFGLVMNHFDVLKEAIAEEGGTLVKTIGDAVMAVFRRPIGGIRAILKAQNLLSSPSQDRQALVLKAGLHYGPSIAVTLNERLDYFGSTVNMAARLEHLSLGGDVVISQAVLSDPEVKEWVEHSKESFHLESIDAQLKGFGEERFGLWRIRP